MQENNPQNIENAAIGGINLTPEAQQVIKDQVQNIKEQGEPVNNGPRIVQTDADSKNGQNACPTCGSTDISLDIKTGKLRCNFCRAEFEPAKVNGLVEDLSKLNGQVYGSGAQNIIADTSDFVTLKCTSCGSEVVVDTASATQARCHWCRHTLSINQQIPNGSVPDVVLPFRVNKDLAKMQIEKFVGKRKFFAHPKFKQEFTTENIMGVYFPYMVVDVNGHSHYIGEGEHLVRTYTVGSGDKKETRYDADLYAVERDFDLVIEGLTVESKADRLNNAAQDKTNNIINSIMPFDIENCVKYDSNLIKGFTSERRDTNIDDLRVLVATQSKDISRFAANETLKFYDRGVAWKSEQFEIKGQQWKAAYLPVWLYSYQEVKGNTKLLHYVAVNARTQETMGSVPIHMPKLLLVSALVEILGIIGAVEIDSGYSFILLATGIVYFLVMYSRYRNKGARHKHEIETKKEMSNVKCADNFVKHERGLSNSRMRGANNTNVSGQTNTTNKWLNSITQAEDITKFIKK